MAVFECANIQRLKPLHSERPVETRHCLVSTKLVQQSRTRQCICPLFFCFSIFLLQYICMHKVNNQEIAGIFYEIALYLEMEDVAFKPRAYERAAQAIEAMSEEAYDIYNKEGKKGLDAIPGVGKSMTDKMIEIFKTGRLKYLNQLHKKFPVKIKEITAIEGVGPKMVKTLYIKLGVKNLRDLERAARAGKIAKLSGFGTKTQENILEGIEFLKKAKGRVPLGYYIDLAYAIRDELKKTPGTTHAEIAGSVRRRRATIKDFDFIACSTAPKKLLKKFTSLPDVARILERGENRAFVRLKQKIDADLLVLPKDKYGSALLHFTGSRFHNIKLRTMAKERGWTLNEYGIFKGKKLLAAKTEKEMYKTFGMDWIPPEIREDQGEIEAALKHKLPKLIPYGSVQGDLQIQTNWTDGAYTIEEMARAAKKLGRKYIAITDHTKALAMTGGLDEKDLARQAKEIEKLNKKIKNFRIIKSAEINILNEGKLDINEKGLKSLEIVSVAVHSGFSQNERVMTNRIVKAMQNPYVNILFHPTGRILGRRPEYAVNIDTIIKAAKKFNIALELNCFPDRIDLKDTNVRKAIEAGVKIVIDTDAHHIDHLKYIPLGEATARRGWAGKSDVLNTMPANKLLAYFKKARG